MPRPFQLVRGPHGEEALTAFVEGAALLGLPLANKGTAFSPEERRALGLEGLLPPRVNTLEQQVDRAYAAYQREPTPLLRHQFLRGLQDRQEILYYALLSQHLEEMLPVVYTPTVGDAVLDFSALYQTPRGLSFSPHNIGDADAVLANYPLDDVRMIVATDASAILGIGDQGWGGLGIPIGKLALYTVGGGVSPFHTLPVVLDVGTDRDKLRNDPGYLGVPSSRLRGEAYLSFIDRFVDAVHRRWPHAILQWEDLSKDTAFTVLDRVRKRHPSFNDDIQGTGAMALAGVLAACAIKKEPLAEQRIVVYGAGAGGIGVAWTLRRGLERAGLTRQEARQRLFVLDSGGLLTDERVLDAHKRSFAQPAALTQSWSGRDLIETLTRTKATILLGLSGQPGSFDERVVRALCANTAQPVIFPLSNPNSACEANPADLLHWSGGRALVAAGSPYPPAVLDGKPHRIAQGNNAFIFPGLGQGAILSRCREITDEMVLVAAETLAAYTVAEVAGRLYPEVNALPAVSSAVTTAVMFEALRQGVAGLAADASHAGLHFWQPKYLPVHPAPANSSEKLDCSAM